MDVDGTVQTLTRLVALVRRRAHALKERMGITTLQLQAMHLLAANDGMTLSELSRRIHLNLSTVSALADRMKKRGMIVKTRDPDDRRVVRVRLSDPARQLLGALPVAPFSFFREALAPLTADEKRELHRLVRKIGAELERKLGASATEGP